VSDGTSLLRRFRDRDHTQGSLLTSILVLSLPSILTSVAGFGLLQLIDLFILGELGSEAIAAAGATNQTLRQVIFLAIMGVTVASQMMISRFVGMENIDAAEHVAGQTFLVGLCVAAIAGLGVFFPRPLVALIASDPAVVELGAIYLQITLATLITTVTFQLLSSVLNGAGDTTTAMLISLATTPVAAAAEWVLAFGEFGFPRMGIAGVALGAALGSACGAGVLLWAIASGRCRVHLRPRHLRLDPALFGRILALSWQPAFHMIARTAIVMLFMVLAGWLGSDVQAAYTIGLRIEMLAFMVAFPIANAAATLVGQNLGAGNTDRLWRSIWVGYGVEVAMLWPAALGLFVFREDLVGLFTQDPRVAALASEYLAYSAGVMVFYGFYFVSFRALQAAGDMNSPMIISISCALFIGVPLGYFLATRSDLGATGMWIANLIYGMANTALTVGWLLWGRWSRRSALSGPPGTQGLDPAR